MTQENTFLSEVSFSSHFSRFKVTTCRIENCLRLASPGGSIRKDTALSTVRPHSKVHIDVDARQYLAVCRGHCENMCCYYLGGPHLTCWCWAAPGSVTGQLGPALQRLLGCHGWRSCGRTVERRWSPHRSPPHPSSLTHLTIAGPGTHSSAHFPQVHTGTHGHKWTQSPHFLLRKITETLRICATCPRQLHTHGCIRGLCWREESDTCTHSIHPSLLLSYDLIPD